MMIVVLAACLAEQDNPLVEGAVATCSDGIQNQNEDDIDCGGPCDACPEVVDPVVSPCHTTAASDVLKFNGLSVDLNARQPSCDMSSSSGGPYYQVSVSTSYLYCVIRLRINKVPTTDGTYPLTSAYYDLAYGQASIYVVYSNLYFYPTDGDVYVNITDDGVNLELCDVTMEALEYDVSAPLTARITCAD